MRALLILAIAATAGAADAVHAELAEALYTYEPSYFALEPAWATRPLNAKFQFSFAFRVAGPALPTAQGPLRPDGWYAAYSQTSFWDLQSESKPFLDSSYRPESWYHLGLPNPSWANAAGIEPGIGHESNGRSGPDSRSLNHVFLRTLAAWQVDDLTVIVDPRVRSYTEREDNPDIAEYRGLFDLHAAVTQRNAWGLALTGRIGSQANRGSLMAELTHPLAPWTNNWMQGFLYVQGFVGTGETLLYYTERSSPPRVLFGFAITR